MRRLVRPHRLFLAAGLLAASTMPPAAYGQQDARFEPCRQKFVQCVQATGNPLECQAVSAACLADFTVDERSAELSEVVALEQADGLLYARMTVSNGGVRAMPLGMRAWAFTCSDGSRETVHFPFNRSIEPGESLISDRRVACFGQLSATPDGGLQVDTQNFQSLESMDFSCSADDSLVVMLKIESDRIIRFSRSDGQSGVFNRKSSSPGDLYDLACEEGQEAREGAQVQAIRQQTIIKLEPWFAEIDRVLGLRNKPADTGTIGTRN